MLTFNLMRIRIRVTKKTLQNSNLSKIAILYSLWVVFLLKIARSTTEERRSKSIGVIYVHTRIAKKSMEVRGL